MIFTPISQGLAFGRLGGVGADGRLTGLFHFFFIVLSGWFPGREEEALPM